LKKGFRVQLVNPKIRGMQNVKVELEGAKHERAISSGLLNMIEESRFLLPDVQTVPGVSKWMPELESELLSWTGKPEETADQIDICSYAADHVVNHSIEWGGVVTAGYVKVGSR
jgi:hypothetical protein